MIKTRGKPKFFITHISHMRLATIDEYGSRSRELCKPDTKPYLIMTIDLEGEAVVYCRRWVAYDPEKQLLREADNSVLFNLGLRTDALIEAYRANNKKFKLIMQYVGSFFLHEGIGEWTILWEGTESWLYESAENTEGYTATMYRLLMSCTVSQYMPVRGPTLVGHLKTDYRIVPWRDVLDAVKINP